MNTNNSTDQNTKIEYLKLIYRKNLSIKQLSIENIAFSPKKVNMFFKLINENYKNLDEILKYIKLSKKKIAIVIEHFIKHNISVANILKEEYQDYTIKLSSGTGTRVNKIVCGSRGSRFLSTRRNSNIYGKIVFVNKKTIEYFKKFNIQYKYAQKN